MLYRMSYSSIIRESEDLGAGIFDREGNNLAESDSTPMFMGAMPKIVKNVIRILGDDIHDGRRDPAQRPVRRRHALARRRDRDPDLPRGRAGRLLGRLGARARHRRRLSRASRSTSSTTGRRATSTGPSSSQEKGVWQDGAVEAHPRERPHAELQQRRHPGDDRRLRAGAAAATPSCSAATARRRCSASRGPGSTTPRRCCARRSRRCRTAVYETEVGWLDDDGRNRGVQLPVKVAVVIEGDEITFDLTGSSDEVPTGYNCPFEGTTVSAMTFITRMIFLDEVDLSRSSCRRTRACSRRST